MTVVHDAKQNKQNEKLNKKRKSPRKFYVAVIVDNEVILVKRSYSAEAQQRIFDEYAALGYRVEKGFIQPREKGLLTWRKAKCKEYRKVGYKHMEVRREIIQ